MIPLAHLVALLALAFGGDPPAKKGEDATLAAEAARAKVVAAERLKALAASAEKGKDRDKAAEARVKALREVLKARERLVTEWEKTVRSRQAVLNPDPTPEAEAAELASAADRARVALDRGKADPNGLLPESFRDPKGPTTEAALAEMKEAVDDAQDNVENLTKERETLSASHGRKASTPLAAAKAERDEIRKRIAALGPKSAEADAAIGSATSADERELAREKLANLDWETRVEAERLKEVEARIDLESRKAATAEVRGKALDAKIELARVTAAALQARYSQRQDLQTAELKRKAADEKAKAEHANDPLERYRARRSQELSEAKARRSENERELKAPLPVDEREQAVRADKAASDFEKLKAMVKGGRSSALVAQRLINTFRRLDTERDAIRRDELARVTGLLARYEGDLVDLELDGLNDARGDRALRENLLNAIPESRKAEARALFEKCEREHRVEDETRHAVLTQLEERAEKARAEVLRRLRILDDQHAFVRTHLFWVRDAQPIGTATVPLLRREARDLARTVLEIAGDPLDRARWERPSPRFLFATAGLVALPYLLYRVRKRLRGLLVRVEVTPVRA